MVGMPASESSSTRWPSCTACTMVSLRSASLWSWLTMMRPRVRTPSPEARVRSLRVSSTAMRSAVARAERSRSEASARLPMGVPPRMSTPPSSEVTAVSAVSAMSVWGPWTVSKGSVVASVYSADAVMAGLVSVSGLRVPTKCNARALSDAGWAY